MSSERRDYFRIELSAVVDYQCITEQQLHNQDLYALFDDGDLIKIHAELTQLDLESTQLLQQIHDKDRMLGGYLHILNRKINLLSAQITASQAHTKNTARTISLSEVGLRFSSVKALPIKQYIALHLHFSNSSVATMVCAEVARCEPGRDNDYQIAAKFHYTSGAQRQQISQQMMRSQLAAKRSETKKAFTEK